MIIEKVVQKDEHPVRAAIKDAEDISSEAVRLTITDLIDSMRHYNLVGMAAPQIGVPLKVFVTEVRETIYRKGLNIKSGLHVFINPTIIRHSAEENIDYEGCGSVSSAGLFGPVKRWNEVVVKAFDREGNGFEFKAEGFIARVIQHELDHLEGVLFIDKVTDPKLIINREEYIKKFKT